MILQQRRLLLPQAFRDILTFLFREYDAVEVLVNDVVVVEGAGVLRDDVEGATEGAERAAVDGVGVGGGGDVGARFVDCVVDHVGGCVEEAGGTAEVGGMLVRGCDVVEVIR